MSKPDHYIATTHIRHDGTIYAPGDEIPASKMKPDIAEYHAKKGRITLPGQPQDGRPFEKSELMDENKSFTTALVEKAGYPEAEWGELNKEPLIDYYLEKQSGGS